MILWGSLKRNAKPRKNQSSRNPTKTSYSLVLTESKTLSNKSRIIQRKPRKRRKKKIFPSSTRTSNRG